MRTGLAGALPLRALFVALTVLLLGMFAAPAIGQASQPAINLTTDHELQAAGAYDGYAVVLVSGSVSPPPPEGSSVVVTTTNPNGVVMRSDIEPLLPATGAFTDSIVVGCTPDWISGFYQLSVKLSGSPGVAATKTFEYAIEDPSMDIVTARVTPQSASGSGLITVSGTVSACSGVAAQKAVSIAVKNPKGATVYSTVASVIPSNRPEDGNYALNFTAGGSSDWVLGTYVAYAYFSSNSNSPTPASASATFAYLGIPGQTAANTSSTSLSPSATATSPLTNSAGSSSNGVPASLAVISLVIVASGAAGLFVGLRRRQSGPSS